MMRWFRNISLILLLQLIFLGVAGGAYEAIALVACCTLLLRAQAVSSNVAQPGRQPSLVHARSLESQGAFEEAATEYRAILGVTPSETVARMALGRTLAKLGRCDEASSTFSWQQLGDQTSGERARVLGVCYFRTGRFTEAIVKLKTAADLDRNDEPARIYLGRAYASAGRNREGIQVLKAWLSAHPNDLDALYWCGRIYNTLSEQKYEDMTHRSPNHYLVLELEGDQFKLRQEYTKALESYREALQKAPKVPGLHFNVGDIYWRLRQFTRAEPELREELKINPYHARANFELGDIAVRRGDPARGMSYLARALRLDPNFMEAHRSMGKALLAGGQYASALQEFTTVARAEPDDHTIHALLASTYRRMGRAAEADKESRASQRLASKDVARVGALKSDEQNVNK